MENNPLYKRIKANPIYVQSFPEAILFKAKIAPSWVGLEEDPVIIVEGQEMAFRNFIKKGVGKEVSLATRTEPPKIMDVGSPSRDVGDKEIAEVSSKEMVAVESTVADNVTEPVVDLEDYVLKDLKESGIGSRVVNRRGQAEESNKIKKTTQNVPTAKKAKAGKNKEKIEREEIEENMAGIFGKMVTGYDCEVLAETPGPTTCHRMMGLCAPKGWIKGLNKMEVSDLLDMQNYSAIQLETIDNVVSARARECLFDLKKCQEEVEVLTAEAAARGAKVKELEKGIEGSQIVKYAREEISKLQKALRDQGEEMVKIRSEKEKQVAEMQGQIYELKGANVELQTQVEGLKGKCQGLVTQVVPHVCKELMCSEEYGVLFAECVNANRVEERSMVLEEFDAEGKVVLTEREDCKANATQLSKAANEALAAAQFPYLQEVASKFDASVEDLLALRPKSGQQA